MSSATFVAPSFAAPSNSIFVSGPDPLYCSGMGDAKKFDLCESAPILDEEDEETLAAIDRGITAADEGRVVPLEDVRRRMQTWLTKPSSQKTP
jgi:hypothetical protein